MYKHILNVQNETLENLFDAIPDDEMNQVITDLTLQLLDRQRHDECELLITYAV